VEHDTAYGPHCHVNCDCGRFLEIGNSVFMQFQKQVDGSFSELPQKNIDFGGGLERILAAANDTADIFVNDLHWPIIEAVVALSGKPYGDDNRYAYQVIADHLKAATCLISDGVVPSNKAQGYVLRRIIRRAIRFGQELGVERGLTEAVARAVIDMYADAYPHMLKQREETLMQLREEEVKFLRTLARGITELAKYIDRYYPSAPVKEEVAERAFDFYQTSGLPVDVFLDELIKRFPHAYSIDDRQKIHELAQKRFAEHQELSRSASQGMFKGGLGGDSQKELEYHTVTHLLQQALRLVLGDQVIQRGSNITPERVRFDFSFDRRLTSAEKTEVEQIVNEQIAAKLPVSYTLLARTEADSIGAIHAFGEKYGETVKVYSIGLLPDGVTLPEGDTAAEISSLAPRESVFSREFCGGPHVANTGAIQGVFVIEKDEKIARDVVRIRGALR
jgi:alanyl-tRNA synthetase